MMALCIALLLLGILLLVVEIFFPGFGVFGFGGIAALVTSAVFAVIYVPFGWLFVIAEAVLLGLLGLGMYRYIRRKQLYDKLIMTETLQEDYSQDRDLQGFLGREGVALTTLRPFGVADFNGTRMDVSSDGPYIGKSRRVKVIEVQNRKIIVRAV